MTAKHLNRLRSRLATETRPEWMGLTEWAEYQQHTRNMIAAVESDDYTAIDAADHARMSRLRGAE